MSSPHRSSKHSKPGDHLLDPEAFLQILDLDEDDMQHLFSKGMYKDYFAQARQTFQEMGVAIAREDLVTLSKLGHFLKGSSATLGIRKVQALCELMQDLGLQREIRDGHQKSLTSEQALERIRPLLANIQKEYDNATREVDRQYCRLNSPLNLGSEI